MILIIPFSKRLHFFFFLIQYFIDLNVICRTYTYQNTSMVFNIFFDIAQRNSFNLNSIKKKFIIRKEKNLTLIFLIIIV